MQRSAWWAQLAEDDRSILLQAAMISPPISLDNLIGVSAASPVRVLRLMERLVDDKILVPDDTMGRGYYYFASPESIDLLLDSFQLGELRDTAQKSIAYFDAHLEDGLKKDFILAYLHHISGIKPQRPDRFLACADYCLQLRLKDEAALYYRMTLEALAAPIRSRSDESTYIQAVLGYIAAHGHIIPLVDQERYLRTALGWAKRLEDREKMAHLELVYAQVCKSEGKYKKASALFEEAWILAREQGKEELLKKAALMTTDFLFWQGRVTDAVERYEEVIGNLEEIPGDEAMLKACATLGWCYGICGRTARGLGLIEAVRLRAKDLRLKEVKVFADLMTVLALLEARRIDEAEVYLNDIFSLPSQMLGHYVLWAASASMAYILYTRGDETGCFRLQKQAFEHAKEYGRSHHRGPWNFEYLDGLEDSGLVHPQMNYESEIKRMLSWPDIYMKGVAKRYRAQRALKNHGPRKRILADLRSSEDLLTRAGARLELARTQLLLGRLMVEDGKNKKAEVLLTEAWSVLSTVNEALFPKDLRNHIATERREELLVSTVVKVAETLGTVRNLKLLLERIINLTMGLTLAQWGGFFQISETGQPELMASRNLDSAMVDTARFAPIRETVDHVFGTGECVTRKAGSTRRGIMRHSMGLGWMICSPVVHEGQVLGVLYLEGLLNRREFPENELPLLRAICTQVAIALDNVRTYEEIAQLKNRLEEETRYYRMESDQSPHMGQIVGQSKSMLLVKKQMEKIAPMDTTVLITGPTGVGKELVARGIHRLSRRAEGPFIALNTASLAEGLIASELFGHERGAFTGAHRTRPGRFELANGGTLFLDDVQNLPLDIQAKLLRALQEKEFERVGGTRTIRSDFRCIAATNQSLERLVDQKRFRSDLYFRLKVFPIDVPPLVERKDDIPLLVGYFFKEYTKMMGKQLRSISNSDMKRLIEYSWPGNVRELKHVVERAVILSERRHPSVPNLKESFSIDSRQGKWKSLEELQKSYITECLEECGWRISGPYGAARLLGLKPTSLHSKMKRLGIRRKKFLPELLVSG